MRRRHMIILGTLFLFLSASAALFGAEIKEFSQVVDLDPGGTLKMDTYKGTIILESWDKNQVEIIARVEAPDDLDDDYAEAVVRATEVEVSSNGKSLTIRSNYDDVPSQKNWLGFGTQKTLPYVHYEIRAPYHINLRLKDYKSEIQLFSFEGNLDIETYKGKITGKDLSGEIELNTYKGTGDFSDLNGTFDIETYKGDLTIQVEDVTGNSRLDTYKGNITLIVPKSQGFELRADLSRKGTLVNALGGASETNKGTDIRKSINGGGPVLRIETYKGHIRLKH